MGCNHRYRMEPYCRLHLIIIAVIWVCSPVKAETPLPITLPTPVLFTLPPNNFCESGEKPKDGPFITCGTCEGRCGTLREFISSRQHKPPRFCTCDNKCIAYGDCCHDFETKCPKEFAEGAPFKETFIYNRVRCERIPTVKNRGGSVISIHGIVPSFPEYTFINGCGKTGAICNRTSEYDLLQPNLALPVTDTETGLHYINFQCAKCNGVKNITWWIPQLACAISEISNFNGSFVIETEEDLKRYLTVCTIHYVIPKGVVPRYNCQPIDRSCPKTCNNKALVDKCEKSYVADYLEVGRRKRYDNYYCALCNGEELYALQCARIEEFEVLPGGRGGVEQFSLSLLFDFDPSDGLVVGQRPCPPYQERVGTSGECRQVGCPEDLRFVEGNCLARSLNVTFISAILRFNNSEDAGEAIIGLSDAKFTEAIAKKLRLNLQRHLNGTNADEATLEVVNEVNVFATKGLNLTLLALFQFGPNSTFNIESDLQAVMSNVTEFTNNEIILALQARTIDLTMVEIEIDGKLAFRQDALADCSWFLFEEDEFYIMNSTLTIQSISTFYNRDRYRLLEDTAALVCVTNEVDQGLDLDVSPALGIVTIVCISISIVCLLIRIILQFKIRYYRCYAAKLHFNLCIALCAAFLMLLLGGVVALYDIQPLCTAFGVLMYWLFMAAFFWMTAIAFDTWLVFRPSSQFVKAEDSQKSLLGYVLPCWVLPAVIAVIVVGLDFADIDSRFQAKFGVKLCWFNRRYALLVYLGVPVAISTLMTLILFILIVVHLRRTIQQSVRPSSDKEQHQFAIYLRLFALMGICWIFGFVAAFVGHDALWFVFIILNASQGIFFFISFVLRRPVINELVKRYRDYSEASSRPTNSTSLSSPINMSDISRATKSEQMSVL